MDGFISLLKPPGMTSSDAVLFIRKLLPKGTKTGHCGTLDPDAAGVLVVSVGKATRLFDYVIDKRKEYLATVTFGVATNTQDASGSVISRCDCDVTREMILEAIPEFTGSIMQTPPMFSAIKRDGKRLYDVARSGGTVDVSPRSVEVEKIECLEKLGKNSFMLDVVCHKGVYIRTLCNDLGQKIGCGAHMSFLLRTHVASFGINEAATVEELKSWEDVRERLVDMDAPLDFLPAIRLDESHRMAVMCGNSFFSPDRANKSGFYRVYVNDDFAGISVCDDAGKHSFKCMLLGK